MSTKTRVVQGASTRQKFAAGFLAAVMAMSMTVSAPALAFAAESTDDVAITDVADACSINIETNPLHVKPNTQTNLVQEAGITCAEGHHVEFKVLSGDAGTVNRRGVFSSYASGTATIGVYEHEGTEPAPGPGTDPAVDAICSTTMSVIVDAQTPTQTYTFQGNDQAILMTNPTVKSFTGSDTAGYVNQLGKVATDDDGYITFNITMQAGFGDNIQNWLKNNAKNIVLTSSDLSQSYDANSEYIEVTAASSSSRTQIVVTIDAVGLADLGVKVGSNCTLTFDSSFSGNNVNRTLGVPVAFDFTV